MCSLQKLHQLQEEGWREWCECRRLCFASSEKKKINQETDYFGMYAISDWPLVQLKCTKWHPISARCQFRSSKISLLLQSYSRERKILFLENISWYIKFYQRITEKFCLQVFWLKINCWFVIEKFYHFFQWN